MHCEINEVQNKNISHLLVKKNSHQRNNIQDIKMFIVYNRKQILKHNNLKMEGGTRKIYSTMGKMFVINVAVPGSY